MRRAMPVHRKTEWVVLYRAHPTLTGCKGREIFQSCKNQNKLEWKFPKYPECSGVKVSLRQKNKGVHHYEKRLGIMRLFFHAPATPILVLSAKLMDGMDNKLFIVPITSSNKSQQIPTTSQQEMMDEKIDGGAFFSHF